MRMYVHITAIFFYMLVHTIDREIFVVKKFCHSPSTLKINPTKYFLQHINGEILYCRAVIVLKIKLGKNLTDEIFYCRKIPNLWYLTRPFKKWCRCKHLHHFLKGRVNVCDMSLCTTKVVHRDAYGAIHICHCTCIFLYFINASLQLWVVY